MIHRTTALTFTDALKAKALPSSSASGHGFSFTFRQHQPKPWLATAGFFWPHPSPPTHVVAPNPLVKPGRSATVLDGDIPVSSRPKEKFVETHQSMTRSTRT